MRWVQVVGMVVAVAGFFDWVSAAHPIVTPWAGLAVVTGNYVDLFAILAGGALVAGPLIWPR